MQNHAQYMSEIRTFVSTDFRHILEFFLKYKLFGNRRCYWHLKSTLVQISDTYCTLDLQFTQSFCILSSVLLLTTMAE